MHTFPLITNFREKKMFLLNHKFQILFLVKYFILSGKKIVISYHKFLILFVGIFSINKYNEYIYIYINKIFSLILNLQGKKNVSFIP